MGTANNKIQLGKLAELGITGVKTQEKAKEILLGKLAENQVDGVDDESLDDLIEMYSPFYEAPSEEATQEEVVEETEETTEEVEEIEELPEEGDYDELAEEVAEEVAATPAKKVVAKKPAAAKKVVSTREKGTSFSPLDNEEHVAMLAPFKKLFPKEEFKLLKQGFTIFSPLQSSRKAIISYDRIKITEDGLVGDLFFNALKGEEEVKKALGEDFERDLKHFNNNLMFTSRVPLAEVLLILSKEFVAMMKANLEKVDKRLTQNRERLETKLKEEAKTAAKKPVATNGVAVKKKPVPVVDEVEEEMVEEEIEETVEEEVVVEKSAPAKKVVPTAVKKPAPAPVKTTQTKPTKTK